MDGSGKAGRKPEPSERTGGHLQTDVPKALYPDRAVFDHADKGRFNMFDKVSGSRQIRERFSKRNRWEDIRDYWYKDAEDFRKLSKKYYLYK